MSTYWTAVSRISDISQLSENGRRLLAILELLEPVLDAPEPESSSDIVVETLVDSVPQWITDCADNTEDFQTAPILLQNEGISVGDVGVMTSDGAFEFFFNICQNSDHPINCGVNGTCTRLTRPNILREQLYHLPRPPIQNDCEVYVTASQTRLKCLFN